MVNSPELPVSNGPEVVQGEPATYPWNQNEQGAECSSGSRYDIYAGCFGSKDIVEALGPEKANEPEAHNVHRQTYALFRLHVDGQAGYERGSFRLFTEAYAVAELLSGAMQTTVFSQLDEALRMQADEILDCPLSEFGEHLGEFLGLVIVRLQLHKMFAGKQLRHRCQVVGAEAGDGSTKAPLNNVILEDIQRVRSQIRAGERSPVLDGYLKRDHQFGRVSLDSPEGEELAYQSLSVANALPGCWPSEEHLSRSERLAINLVYRELHDRAGIQAVSMPMGASPHRVIREIVADALIGRADVLASLPRSSFAFMHRTAGGESDGPHHVWGLIDDLRDYSVVVTSPSTTLMAELEEKLTLPKLADEECTLMDQILREGFFTADPSSAMWMRDFHAGHLENDVGLSRALRESRANRLLNETKNTTWRKAINDYHAAKYRVTALREGGSPVALQCRRINHLRARLKKLEHNMAASQVAFSAHVRELAAQGEAELELHQEQMDNRPAKGVGIGWLKKLLPRGRSVQEPSISQGIYRLRGMVERTRATIALEEAGLKQLECQISALEGEWRAELEKVTPYIEQHKVSYLTDWLEGKSPLAQDIELSESCMDAELTQAQAELFNQSLKLHAVFIRLESRKLIHNLRIVWQLSKGGAATGFDEAGLSSVWESLFMISPVVRMNTHALSGILKTVGPNRIGWMIMCGAGKASPQAALGALYRAKRYVSIGDRNDLRPQPIATTTLSRLMLGNMNGDAQLRDAEMSAQSMAEDASSFGYVRVTDMGTDWVGLPIRSVEFGNEPMLSILSRVSTGAQLIARNSDGGEIDAFDSGWVNIRSAVTSGWLDAELQAVERILNILLVRGVSAPDIELVSPFHRVKVELHKRFCRSGCGQRDLEALWGRQSSYVILVLGGADPREREGVSRSPGIISAVAGGARRGIFVIGDRAEWGRRPAMKAAAELLPLVSVDVNRSAGEG